MVYFFPKKNFLKPRWALFFPISGFSLLGFFFFFRVFFFGEGFFPKDSGNGFFI